MRRFLTACCAAAMASCMIPLGTSNAVWAKETVTVTDMVKRTVEAPRNPDRIVCLTSGCLRLICYLNRSDRVVGVEQFEKIRTFGRPYALAHPELLTLPSVGPGGPTTINSEPDLEAVLKVKPDVIFITYMQKDKADALQKKIGIPVIILTYGTFGTFDEVVYESLRVAGKVLAAEERSEQVISFIEAARNDLKQRTAGFEDAAKPAVYVGGIGYKGVQGIESTDASYVPLEWVAARNVAKKTGQKAHFFIDKEQLLNWDPDVIFVDGGGLELVRQDLAKKGEFYAGLKAVKTGRVYSIHPFNWYMTNIGTAAAGAYAAGKILYPDRFQDVDPGEKADEIYRFLVGKPVNQHMVNTYGPLGASVLPAR